MRVEFLAITDADCFKDARQPSTKRPEPLARDDGQQPITHQQPPEFQWRNALEDVVPSTPIRTKQLKVVKLFSSPRAVYVNSFLEMFPLERGVLEGPPWEALRLPTCAFPKFHRCA